jgi:hypothetical protein
MWVNYCKDLYCGASHISLWAYYSKISFFYFGPQNFFGQLHPFEG